LTSRVLPNSNDNPAIEYIYRKDRTDRVMGVEARFNMPTTEQMDQKDHTDHKEDKDRKEQKEHSNKRNEGNDARKKEEFVKPS
jgi:hypothetical protein